MTNFKFAALTACFVALLSFQSHQQKKTYKVEQTLDFWIQVTNGIEFTKNNLKTSDLSSKTVTLINDSLLTVLQVEISKQINAQLEAEKKKDTITKPKK